MVLTLMFCFLASSWRALRADSSNLNEAVAVFGLTLFQQPRGFALLLACPMSHQGHLSEAHFRLHLNAENTRSLYTERRLFSQVKYMDADKHQSRLSTQFYTKRHCLNCEKPLDETKELCSDCLMVANLFIG